MTTCVVCGGTEFVTDIGFSYCSTCQTQVEDFRDEVIDLTPGQTGRRIRKERPERSRKLTVTGFKDQLTSWELYNYILQGLVDEMVNLGADKSLKSTVLQLWISYLSHLEIAFTGKKAIHVGLNYKMKDVEILFGKPFKEVTKSKNADILKMKTKFCRTKKKKLKDLESSAKSLAVESNAGDQLSKSQKRQRTLLLRKLASQETSQQLSQEGLSQMSQTQILSQNLEDLQTDVKNSERVNERLVLSKNAKEKLKEVKSKVGNVSFIDKMNQLKKVANSMSHTAYNLSLSSLLGVLQIGLFLSSEKAQISDTIRWIQEGHLSYSQITKLIPSDVNLDLVPNWLLEHRMTYSGLCKTVMKIVKLLSITEIPQPDYEALINRYFKELNLPNDLKCMVFTLMSMFPPEESIESIILCEAQAVAYIIIVLKLTFCLDGVTEKKLSELADFVNSSNLNGHSSQFFSWTKWVRFVELRKAVLSLFHYPMRVSIYGSRYINRDSSSSLLAINHWKKMHYKVNQQKNNLNLNKSEKISDLLDSVGFKTPDNEVEFPSSLTPMYTYTRILLDNHLDKLETEAINILRQDFTSISVLLPDMYRELEQAHGIVIKNPGWSLPHKVISLANSQRIPRCYKPGNVNVVFSKYAVIDSNESCSSKRKRVDDTDDEEIEGNEKDTEDELDVKKMREKLLAERLKEIEEEEKEEQRKKKRLRNDDDDDVFISFVTDKRTFILKNAESNYWMLHGKFEDRFTTIDQFNLFCVQMLPSSFTWLLKECSRMIEICPRTLYRYVVNVERRVMNSTNSVN